jgi:chromosome segregation ATPase
MEVEIARLEKEVEEYAKLRLRFDAAASARQQLTIDVVETQDEIVRNTRKLEKQIPELATLESRRQDAEKRKEAVAAALIPIRKRTAELDERRAALEAKSKEVDAQRQALVELRMKSKELQIEERRVEEALKSARRKEEQAKEDLRLKADAVFKGKRHPREVAVLLGDVEADADSDADAADATPLDS